MAKRLNAMLKKLRLETGLTQEELGKKVGGSDAYITMLESGARKNPTVALLKKLAKALGVPGGKLLE